MSTRKASTLNKTTAAGGLKKKKHKVSVVKGGAFYDYTLNKILNTKNNKLKDGERHGVIYTNNDGYQPASYMGPSTQLFERLKKHDKPLSYTDNASMVHDIRYSLAKNEEDIRIADNKMISSLEKAKREKLDYNFNINQGIYGIQAKIFLEDYFYVPKTTFTTFGEEHLSPEEKALYTKVLGEEQMKGFGKCKFK